MIEKRFAALIAPGACNFHFLCRCNFCRLDSRMAALKNLLQ
jgi:hypothetical protein